MHDLRRKRFPLKDALQGPQAPTNFTEIEYFLESWKGFSRLVPNFVCISALLDRIFQEV